MACANSKAVFINWAWNYLSNAIFNGNLLNVGGGPEAARFLAFAQNSDLGGLAFDGKLQCASFVMYEGESQQVCIPTAFDYSQSKEVAAAGDALFAIKAATAGYW